jgi:hypothetical protein
MKKQFLLFILAIFYASQLDATIITVSNNVQDNNAAQYSSLQDAFDAASAGDTVFVSGSSTSYGYVYLSKQIVLIGAGYNPNNQTQLKSQITQFSIEIGMDGFGNPVSNPSGTKIMGFEISYMFVYDNVNDIEVARNYISYLYFYGSGLTDWLIINNIIYSIYNSNNYAIGVVISNNIITYDIYRSSGSSVLISNNLFIKASGASFVNVENAIITNNIFYGAETSGCDYCTFNNNISIGGGYTEFAYENNSAANNLVSTNPQFESVAATAFSYGDDYHLGSSSPGIEGGTDNTDIGIYGGSYPFPSGGDVPYQTSAMPNFPQIIDMNVQNAVLPQNETLQVQVEAKTQE